LRPVVETGVLSPGVVAGAGERGHVRLFADVEVEAARADRAAVGVLVVPLLRRGGVHGVARVEADDEHAILLAGRPAERLHLRQRSVDDHGAQHRTLEVREDHHERVLAVEVVADAHGPPFRVAELGGEGQLGAAAILDLDSHELGRQLGVLRGGGARDDAREERREHETKDRLLLHRHFPGGRSALAERTR